MNHWTNESYITLSKGLKEYQGVYSHAAINLFVVILQEVVWDPKDPDYGSAIFTWKNLKHSIEVSNKTLSKILAELQEGYRLPGLSRSGRQAPPFIRYTILGKKRGKKVHVQVLKPKLRPEHFNRKTQAQKQLDYRKKSSIKRAVNGTKQRGLEADIDDEARALFEKTSKMLDIKRTENKKNKFFTGDTGNE